jgi:microcystin-dependent protein
LSNRRIGDIGGIDSQTVPLPAMPPHTHNIQTIAGQIGDSASPVDKKLGNYKKVGSENYPYSPKETTSEPMSSQAIGIAGGGLPLNNLPPFLTMRYAIAVKGEFPPRE